MLEAETAAKRIRQAVKNGTQLSGSQFMEMVLRHTSLGLAAAEACWPKLTAEVLLLWPWSTRLKTRALAPRSHLLLHMFRILKVLLHSLKMQDVNISLDVAGQFHPVLPCFNTRAAR